MAPWCSTGVEAKRRGSTPPFFSKRIPGMNAMPDRRTKATIVATENQKRARSLPSPALCVLEFEGRACTAFSREIEPNNARVATIDAPRTDLSLSRLLDLCA